MNKASSRRQAFWAYAYVRDEGTAMWHRLTASGVAFCGAHVRDSFEDLPTAVNRCTPPDEELCPRCIQLFEEECRRRLGEAYRLLSDLARRRAAEKRAKDGGTTAG